MNDKDFAKIVNETKSTVLNAVRKNLAPRFYHAIDDVVQETYIRAYKGLVKNTFKQESSLKTWLYAIAKNESRRMGDRLKREEEKFNKKILELNENPDNGKSSNPEENKITIMDLKRLINMLPEKNRDVIELLSLGFTEKEVARKLSIKRGTVKSRAFRGREMMQRISKGGTTA